MVNEMITGIIIFLALCCLIIIIATFCKASEVLESKEADQWDKDHSFMDW